LAQAEAGLGLCDHPSKGAGRYPSPLYLRAGEGAEVEVGDVADDLSVSVAGAVGELFPFGVGGEGGPVRGELGDAGEGEHVGQRGHAGADEGVGEEDGGEAVAGEDLDLGFVEDLHLVLMRDLAGTFVGAELEDAWAGLGRGELWPPGEGGEDGALVALVGRSGGGGVAEAGGGLEVVSVAAEQGVEGDERFGGGAGDEDVVRRCFGADVQFEGADGRDLEPVERRDESVLEVALREGKLRAVAQRVLAKLIELARGLGLG